MSRPQCSAAKEVAVPDSVRLTTEERLELLANLIVDRIAEDAANNHTLLKSMGGNGDAQQQFIHA
ncbi:MAG TPA: hypothetical protein VMB52_04010 [Verrucomicrobiae bacterium]|nr:hypothetical protein [Verrucomicrobiae bacterium]